jgi:hypothetical protein
VLTSREEEPEAALTGFLDRLAKRVEEMGGEVDGEAEGD